MTDTINISIPEIEAAILLEYADRISQGGHFESEAERITFWRFVATLERQVSITFREDYRSLLANGKAKIEAEGA